MIIVESLEQAREVLSSKEKTMICFMARWCPPCRMINLSFEQFEEENPDAKIYKIDVNEYRDLAKELEAVSVPVTLFVNNGESFPNSSKVSKSSKIGPNQDNKYPIAARLSPPSAKSSP